METYRGKPVVDFAMGDVVKGGDVIYRLTQDYDSEESQRDLFDSLLAQIAPSSIEALIIGPWSEAHDQSPEGFLQALIERRAELSGLRALFVGDMTFEDCEISWIIQTSYNDLLAAYPRLESLRIRGSSQLSLQPFEHARLQELAIECGGLPSTIVDSIAASKLPALRNLELWLGDDNYGFDGDLATYQGLIEAIQPERLEYLGLRDASISDELAVWLATQTWLGSLRVLDLSLGTIGDVGAQALCEGVDLSRLERVDLSHHYISSEWQQRLKDRGYQVVLDDPSEEDEGERYVAVAE
ncbi:STM4015 family protein [Dyella silvatica]|uniref:STM4015 family protein n=1 Tax=Dyella silvatica TaxID=2992128 RepID=UPI00225688C3|nr:STM4015 family protein [Dyella silvatica]